VHFRTFVHLQVAAAIVTIALAFAASLAAAPASLPASRAEVLLGQAKWLGLPLAIAVFLVMLQRARSADLILGFLGKPHLSGLPPAFLQNTVEQTLLAILGLAAFISACPSNAVAAVDAFSLLFLIGRALFFFAYSANPMWRFYGFSLSFYPSCLFLVLGWWFALRGA
jgi:hypothetical protein